ncbi:3'(2'),5'-bisphosphate nucleotidase CysQ [Lichenibacterium ramalinae]|uniref:3'(2'),5'-bisphosphate nucleotidase CysQ n=1 Tax=Lichenibacterium ramalinae TaxID=2316527 RepID=UPI001FE110AF|nr:3'(2'),5'-bisphosphate nucleotidase CysQ [Lichenibacterium ramalinae]
MASISPSDSRAVLELLRDAARVAGDMAMDFFRHGAATAARVDFKAGGSPVTEADLAVDRYLHDRLRAAVPGASWLSEETADDLDRLLHDHVIVVDPIDGTRSFAAGDPHWAVSVALVSHGRPVVGVVHAPALAQTYAGALGLGAWVNDRPARASDRAELAGASLSAPNGFIKPLARAVPVALVPRIPSLACRFAAVAGGGLDAAVASPDSHDWDLAGVDIVLHEAGAQLTAADGRPLLYNQRVPRHRTLYAAGPNLHAALLAAGRRTLGGAG